MVERLGHCLDGGLGEIAVPVKTRATRGRTKRPCGALLQPVVVIRLWMQSVAGSHRSHPSGDGGGKIVTPAICRCIAYLAKGTPAGGQFGWGGTPLKTYRGGPKVGSGGLELRR